MVQLLEDARPVSTEGATGELVVEVFAYGLGCPTHMEWSQEGRLLVSDRRRGAVYDITAGGDQSDARPFASRLGAPASILPLGERLLVAETDAGRVTDIAGGDASRREPFARDLAWPYSLAAVTAGGRQRIFVSEYVGLMQGQSTEITSGGGRRDFRPHVTEVPYGRSPRGDLPSDLRLDPCDAAPWKISTRGGSTLVMEANHVIFRVPDEGGRFYDIISDEKNVIATGLYTIGGMKENPVDGLIYAVDPPRGAVLAIDQDRSRDYRFEPPTVWGLKWPSCVRFTPDGDSMFVCSALEGAIWKVRGWRR